MNLISVSYIIFWIPVQRLLCISCLSELFEGSDLHSAAFCLFTFMNVKGVIAKLRHGRGGGVSPSVTGREGV